ncbi:MAG: amidase [bacterium]|nr:amidase [bacterium]
MDGYEDHDALALAALVASGDVTPHELLDAAIARVDARDEVLGAVVARFEDDARRAIDDGLPDGPFRGVPFLLKDLALAIPGSPLTHGSALYEGYVPTVESELVARYRRAGLVTFGRTHSPEFGLTTSTESRLFGQTRNPWKTTHTSGGSSGGASSAVAAGYLPLANASDGGGSIRIPASCCGLFGMKPARGRTPMGPQLGENWSGMSTIHAVSRSVRDSAALLDATSGADPGAPYAAPPPARPFLEEVGADPGRLRIAVQRLGFNGVAPHEDCEAALDEAIALCRVLGHEVEEAPFENLPEGLALAGVTIISASTRASLEERAADLGRPLEQGDVELGTWAMVELAGSRTATDYVNAVRTMHAAGRALAEHMTRFDVVLSPTMAIPPAPLGVLSLSNPDREAQTRTLLQTTGYTQLANLTGNPAMSVPLHWNEEGLPIGLQFMGRTDDEATLFRLAGQLERERPFFDRRPPLD